MLVGSIVLLIEIGTSFSLFVVKMTKGTTNKGDPYPPNLVRLRFPIGKKAPVFKME